MKILNFLISSYQKVVSRPLSFFLGPGCRFTPSCSGYSKEAIVRFGPAKGLALSLKRVLRCHPFSKSSFFDPVPEKNNV